MLVRHELLNEDLSRNEKGLAVFELINAPEEVITDTLEDAVLEAELLGEPVPEDAQAKSDDEVANRRVEAELKRLDLSKDLSIEEAVSHLKHLQEDSIIKEMGVMRNRWMQGVIALHTPTKYGQNTLKQLSKLTGVSENLLREAKRMVTFFEVDFDKYQAWLDESKAQYGRVRTWSEVRSVIRSDDPKRGPLEPEAIKSRIMRRIERTAHDLETINKLAGDSPEVQGVALKTIEEISEFARKGVRVFDPGEKQPIPRSDSYLNFIRALPCAVTGKMGETHAHHTKIGGKGIKGSDYSCIPLCADKHKEYHDIGRQTFEEKYNVNVRELTAEYMHVYLTGQTMHGAVNLPAQVDV